MAAKHNFVVFQPPAKITKKKKDTTASCDCPWIVLWGPWRRCVKRCTYWSLVCLDNGYTEHRCVVELVNTVWGSCERVQPMIGDGLFVEAGVLSACSDSGARHRNVVKWQRCSPGRREAWKRSIIHHIKYRVSCGPWTETISKYYILRSWF